MAKGPKKSLKKSPTKSSKTLERRSRRAFRSWRTGQMSPQVHVIRYKGKRCIIKPFLDQRRARKRFLEHSLLHLLFPKNSIKPLDVITVEVENPEKHGTFCQLPGMVSEIVKGRGSDYKKYQRWLYSLPRGQKKTKTAAVLSHELFCREVGKPLAVRIEQQTGIRPDEHPANICNVNGTPVFFETYSIMGTHLSKHISQVTNATKRKQLRALLDEYLTL